MSARQVCEDLKIYKEFPHRGHWICGQSGWEEIAGYIYDWMQARLMAPVSTQALVM